MGFRINTNTAALAAHASATMNNRALDSSLSKLNSGFRITSAADDASGMAIADSLRSQANALGQAIMNANDAIGVIQTADKAMDEQIKILDTIKTKAIQAAQDTQTTETRRALQADINRLMEQLDNIGNTTSFNGQKLLSGNFSNKEFQIGAYSNETIKASIGPTTTDKIGLTRFETGHNIRLNDVMFAEGMEKTEDGEEGIMSDGKMTLTFKNVDGINDVTLEPVKFASFGKDENGNKTLDIKAGQGLGALVEAINKASDTTGIRASANVKSVFGHVISQGVTTENFRINGVTIGKIEVQSKDANGALRAAINRVKDQTGVEASVDSRGRLVLANRDGRGIKVEDGKLPKPSALPGDGIPAKPDAQAPDNAAPMGVAKPSKPPKTPAQAIANANMHKTPTGAVATKPGTAGAALATANGKVPSGTKIAPDTNGRLALAAATKADQNNNLTIADLKGAIEATTVLDEAAKRAQNNMTDALIAGAGLQPAGQSLRTGGAESADSALKFDALNMQNFAFESNVDVSGGVFGDADAKVGNLEGIRGATTLQGLLDEVRAGAKQLESNIQTIATTAGSTAIGNDAASAVAAQRLAVMMDRKAQLDGFAAAIKGAAEAWAQPPLDATKEVAGKGVVVSAVKDGSPTTIAAKLEFKESAAATGALEAGTAQDGSAVAGKPAGQLAASELPANHPANKPASTDATTGTESSSSPVGQNTPTQTQLKDAASALASVAPTAMNGGAAGSVSNASAIVTSTTTDKISHLSIDSSGNVKGLDALIVGNANNKVTYENVKADLKEAGVFAYIEQDAQKKMADLLKTKLAGTSENVGLEGTDFSGELASISETLLGTGFTAEAITTTTLEGAKNLGTLATNVDTLLSQHAGSGDTGLDTEIGADDESTNANKFKENLGKDIANAMVKGWKAAIDAAQGKVEAAEGENAETKVKNAAAAAAGETKAPNKLTTATSFGKDYVTDTLAQAANVTTKVSVHSGGEKVENLGDFLATDAKNAVTYTSLKAELDKAGAFTYIKDSAKQAMAKNLEAALTKNADGALDMSKLFDASNGNKLTDITESVLVGLQAANASSPMPDSGTEIDAITGAKTLKDLSAALDNLGKKAELQANPEHKDTAVGESAAATVAGELAKAGAREVVAGWKAAVDEVIANATAAANPAHSLRSVRGSNESESESAAQTNAPSKENYAAAASTVAAKAASAASSAKLASDGPIANHQFQTNHSTTDAQLSVAASGTSITGLAALLAPDGENTVTFTGTNKANTIDGALESAGLYAQVKAQAKSEMAALLAAKTAASGFDGSIQFDAGDFVEAKTADKLNTKLGLGVVAGGSDTVDSAVAGWSDKLVKAGGTSAAAFSDLGKLKETLDGLTDAKLTDGANLPLANNDTGSETDQYTTADSIKSNINASIANAMLAGWKEAVADVETEAKKLANQAASETETPTETPSETGGAKPADGAAEEVFKDPDYSDYKAPGEFVAPDTEGAERLTEGLADRAEVAVDMSKLSAPKFAGLAAAGTKGAEIVDVRGLLDTGKNAASTATLGDLVTALGAANVGAKIADAAEVSATQQLASAIGNNIDGTIAGGLKLELSHSIGGAWQHDPELLKDANAATNLADLRHALEAAREALGGDEIALTKAPENPFAEADAELYADEETGGAKPADGQKAARALDDATAQIALNAQLGADDEKTARQTLEKIDAIAQIDGMLKAVDDARLALDDLAEERESMGKSLADIIGLNTENSVNFGRLSLVGAGAKDIQLVITDAHGNDMTSAAGFDRDVHEKTVSLRETNAKTERDVAAAQGFNAEDWMDDDLGENANGYPAGVMTFKGAQAMIDIAETAQKALEAIRSDLGSVQNQLVVTVNNISVTQVNVKAAESNIRDVDFAQESATFSKHQILAQSGVYAMSQANAVQQNVMRLLQ